MNKLNLNDQVIMMKRKPLINIKFPETDQQYNELILEVYKRNNVKTPKFINQKSKSFKNFQISRVELKHLRKDF